MSSQPYGPPVYHAFAPMGMGMAVVSDPLGVLKKIATTPPPPPPPPPKRTRSRSVPLAIRGAHIPVLTLSGVSSQPYGPPVYHAFAPMGGIFGDDEPSILEPTLKDPATGASATVDDKLDEVIRRLKDEERARKISQLVAIGGALFAAARLGIIWLPLFKKRITRSSEP